MLKVGDKVVIDPPVGSDYDPEYLWVPFIGKSGKIREIAGNDLAIIDMEPNTYPFWSLVVGLGYLRKEDSNNPIRPNHYKEGGIEPIEYMRQKMSKEAFVGFCMGNVMKYVGRYEHKNGVEDLKKAQKYMEWGIERYGADAD